MSSRWCCESESTVNMKRPRTVCRKCKYCTRNFHSYVKLLQKHIKNHERRYQKHWLKMIKKNNSVNGKSNTEHHKTCQEAKDEKYFGKSDESSQKMLSKEVFVYIVFAPEGTCSCVSDNRKLHRMPCDCEFTYKKLIFNSIESMHNNTEKGVSYDCPKCHKKVLSEKLRNDSLRLESCLKCNKKFTSVEGLNNHQKKCYGYTTAGQDFKCLQCSHTSTNHKHILVHTVSHSLKGRSTLIGTACVMTSGNKDSDTINAESSTHLNVQAQTAIVVSEKSNASTVHAKSSKHLNGQKQTPTKSKYNAYPCPICSERYSNSYQLKQHVTTHQRKRDKEFTEQVQSTSTKNEMFSSAMDKKGLKRSASKCRYLSTDETGSESDFEDKLISNQAGSSMVKSSMSLRPRKQTKSHTDLDEFFWTDEDDADKEDITKGLPHKCNFCERAFKVAAYLNSHKQTMHSGKAPYVCLVCLKRFQLPEEFKKHSVSHEGSLFNCQLCSASFNKMELLHNHDQIHSNDKPFNCTVCGSTFLNAASLSKHFKTHPVWGVNQESYTTTLERKRNETRLIRNTAYVCPICKSRFYNAPDLKKHSKLHEVERLKCKHCNVICKSRLELMNHTKHRYRCLPCETDYPSMSALKKHEQSHGTSATVYRCSYCPKEFMFKSDFKIHESLHDQFDGNPSQTQKFKCKYCGKGLKYQRDLDIHEILHELKPKIRDYLCDYCGKKYDTKSAMQRHRHNHFRDKLPEPTKCPDCEQIFKYGSLFREHKKKHWPEKPFECMYCKTRFKSRPELDDHEVIHTIGKKHACPICNRRFKKKKNVYIHIRTHTGEKPYECAYCPKRFPQTSLRRRHERIHTGECPYVCNICQRSFPYDSSLKVHYEAHKKKGLEVPRKFGMAKGLQRKNAPARKPPGVTIRKEQRANETSHTADTSTSVNASVTVNPEPQKAVDKPSHVAPALPIPVAIPEAIVESQHVEVPISIPQPKNINAPIQVTIQSPPIQLTIQQGEQMQQATADHHSIHHRLIQQQEEIHRAHEPSWEAHHSRYVQQTSQPNWQSSHNWQPAISQHLQNPSPGNWELPPGSWPAPPPPAVHQRHPVTASVINNPLYGMFQKGNEGQREYQQ